MISPDETRVELRQRLAAAPEQVFAAFAEAGLVPRWLTPAPDITLTLLQFDFREGGAHRFAYHLPEGQTVIVAGVYRSSRLRGLSFLEHRAAGRARRCRFQSDNNRHGPGRRHGTRYPP